MLMRMLRMVMVMMMMMMIVIINCCPQGVQASATPGNAVPGGFPALFVFGDSLLDPGNRHLLIPTGKQLPLPIISADHQPYGCDSPSHLPTGRFSNGFIVSDYLAALMGLPYPPPYLKDKENIMKGCSFATAAATVLNNKNSYQFPRLNFVDQVHLFGDVRQQLVSKLGEQEANHFISRSLFLTCMGANDYIAGYYSNPFGVSSNRKNLTEDQFRNILVSSYKGYLLDLYSLGARKFGVVSLPPMGCIALVRFVTRNDNDVCVPSVNEEATSYNKGLLQMSIELQKEHPDGHFTFLNPYDVSYSIITHPTDHGFVYGFQPCCATGRDGGLPICLKGVSSICKNASEHMFWDFAHPSQALHKVLSERFWAGFPPDVYPINLQDLARL